MIGAIIVAVALLVVIPVGVAISGGAIAAGLAFFLTKEGEEANEGSELIDLNR